MIRRAIFSMNTQSVSGNIPPIANAGPNVSIGSATFVIVDGSSSYDPDGTIVSYLWTQVTAHAGVSIIDSTLAIASPSGLTIPSTNYVFRLTVTDNLGATDSDDITVKTSTDPSSNTLAINSSQPDQFGSGTLDLVAGEPYEVIDLLFTLSGAAGGDSIDFSGANVGVLDSLHTVRTGSVTLSSSGKVAKNYSSSGSGFTCVVEITGRSSAEPIPTVKTTQVIIP